MRYESASSRNFILDLPPNPTSGNMMVHELVSWKLMCCQVSSFLFAFNLCLSKSSFKFSCLNLLLGFYEIRKLGVAEMCMFRRMRGNTLRDEMQ